VCKLFGKDTVVKLVQLWKQYDGISLIFSFNEISFKAEHSLNEEFPSFVKELAKSTDSNFLQAEKAQAPIDVTPFSIVAVLSVSLFKHIGEA
jgi:hypothetical protein